MTNDRVPEIEQDGFDLARGSSPEIKKNYLDILSKQKSIPMEQLHPFLSDVDVSVREFGLDVLSKLHSEEAVPLLIQVAKNDGDESLRTYALNILADYHSEEVLQCLLSEVTRPNSSPIPRQVVATQLGSYDRPESIAALIQLFEDDHYIVEDNATESLLRLNRSSLYPFWQHVLRSSRDPVVLTRAKKALAELKR